MGTAHKNPGARTSFGRVLESNEHRLEALDRKGIPLVVDGRQMLQFFLDRALVSTNSREFELEWALNVAGLVKQFESDALSTGNPAARPSTRRRLA
jgi:hypothetical protein